MRARRSVVMFQEVDHRLGLVAQDRSVFSLCVIGSLIRSQDLKPETFLMLGCV